MKNYKVMVQKGEVENDKMKVCFEIIRANSAKQAEQILKFRLLNSFFFYGKVIEGKTIEV